MVYEDDRWVFPLLGLINGILDISKIEAGREELNIIEFDFNGLVPGLGMMFEMRCWEKGLRWNLDCNTSAKLALGDEGKLRQVLINMLGNAVKFTEKGEVSMLVEARPQRFHFEVPNTGPGIPSERHATVSEPFHQESESSGLGGTGLGLAIARKHVEMMDGELKVKSVVGQGSRFFLNCRWNSSTLQPAR